MQNSKEKNKGEKLAVIRLNEIALEILSASIRFLCFREVLAFAEGTIRTKPGQDIYSK